MNIAHRERAAHTHLARPGGDKVMFLLSGEGTHSGSSRGSPCYCCCGLSRMGHQHISPLCGGPACSVCGAAYNMSQCGGYLGLDDENGRSSLTISPVIRRALRSADKELLPTHLASPGPRPRAAHVPALRDCPLRDPVWACTRVRVQAVPPSPCGGWCGAASTCARARAAPVGGGGGREG